MKDEAISPVIAFMLLLMIIVSFISVLNAYYIPSLKQQSEITHFQEVEDSFIKITPDVLQVLTFRKNLSMKEPIQLGGGDVVFSSLKSSGYLETNTSLQNLPLSQITVSIGSTTAMVSEINRSRVFYRPVSNFWTNQGYEWEDGVLSITKGNKKTYLQYADNADVLAASERKAYYDMMNPVIQVDTSETTPSISINLLNIEEMGANRSVSSNGVGTICVDLKESAKKTLTLNGTTITFKFSGANESELGFKSKINDTFNFVYQYNKTYWDSDTYTLNATPNNVGIYPNLNLILWNLSLRVV